MKYLVEGTWPYRIVVAIFHCFRWVVRALPSETAAQLGSNIGALCLRFFRKEVEITKVQLDFAASHTVEEASTLRSADRSKVPRKMFRHLGECVVELLIADRLFESSPGLNPETPWAPNLKYFTFEADDKVRRMLEEKTSALTLTAHLGSFELLAPFYARVGFNVSVLRRSPNYPILNELQRDFLLWGGTETIWRHERSSTRKLLRCLRDQKRVIAGLIDQDTNLENAFSPFFSLEAASPIAPIRLAIKYALPIYSTFIVRTKRLHHHIIIKPIEYDGGDPAAEKLVLDEYNRRLEALICRFPEQWLWWHRRWRRRPGVDYVSHREQLRGTKAYLEWLKSQSASAPEGASPV